MIGELRSAIAPRLTNSATPERTQYVLSPILFPIEEPLTAEDPAADTTAGDRAAGDADPPVGRGR